MPWRFAWGRAACIAGAVNQVGVGRVRTSSGVFIARAYEGGRDVCTEWLRSVSEREWPPVEALVRVIMLESFNLWLGFCVYVRADFLISPRRPKEKFPLSIPLS